MKRLSRSYQNIKKVFHRVLSPYRVFFATIIGSYFLTLLPESFRLYVIGVAVLFIAFVIIFKNVFVSLFISLIITSQFTWPAKYYEFVLIEGSELHIEALQATGVTEGYGLMASDILSIAIVLFMARTFAVSWLGNDKNSYISLIRDLKLNKSILISWVLYFFLSYLSSLTISFHPVFSLTHLFQIIKIIPVFIVTRFFLLHKHAQVVILQLLAGILCFQAILGLQQLYGGFQLIANNQRFTASYLDLEAEQQVSRARGSFNHANQLALISLLIGLTLISFDAQQPLLKKLTIGVVLGIILFSQSRTIWLIFLFLIGVYALSRRSSLTQLTILWSRISSRVKFWLVLTIVFLGVTIILPRITVLQYASEKGSLGIRAEMIREAIYVLYQTPLIGWGINTNVQVLWEHFPDGYVLDFPHAVHMAYLQMALESGIGAASFFLPFIIGFRRSFFSKEKSEHNLWLRFCCLTILLYYMFQPHGGKTELPWLGLFLALLLPSIETVYEKSISSLVKV